MVQVLVNHGWRWVFECPGCRSELAAVAKDVKIGDGEWYVICPVCKTPNTVPDTEIYPGLRKIVLN